MGGLLGALVNGPGILPGTRVDARNGGNSSVVLSQKFDPSFTPVAGARYTYAFYGPVNATATINPQSQPNVISGLSSQVIEQLLAIAPIDPATNQRVPLVVQGPGVQSGGSVQNPIITRVTQIDPVAGTVTIDRPLNPQQAAGQYVNTFVFS